MFGFLKKLFGINEQPLSSQVEAPAAPYKLEPPEAAPVAAEIPQAASVEFNLPPIEPVTPLPLPVEPNPAPVATAAAKKTRGRKPTAKPQQNKAPTRRGRKPKSQ